jgi:thiol-disulfide isomerase/thioredoxin
MRLPSLVLAAGVALAMALPALADDVAKPVWAADYDKAVELAKAQKKDLLVDFTGSDWCHWCIKLHEEVFDQEAFLSATQKDYVLVALDFPNDPAIKAQVPNPQRNAELARIHQVQGYPTVLLMTPDGDVYGRTGYQAGGAEKYVAHLAELRGSRKLLLAATEIGKAFDAAEGDARAALIEKAVTALSEVKKGAGYAGKLVPAVKAGLTADPDNAKGLKARALGALLTSGTSDTEHRTAAQTLDPKNELGLLEKAVEAQAGAVGSKEALASAVEAIDALDAFGIKDATRKRDLYVNAAHWCHKFLEDPDKAKAYAKKAKEFDHENAGVLEMLDGILDAK